MKKIGYSGGTMGSFFTILAAIIALSGAVIVGYLANFVAEDFRRFRDGSALAAALAGELASHALAVPLIRNGLTQCLASAQQNLRVTHRTFEPPNDPIFEAGVEKLGLLGVKLVEDIAFTYQNLRAFRSGLKVIFDEHQNMSFPELIGRYGDCLQAIDRTVERGEPLLVALRARANTQFEWRWKSFFNVQL
jgi:hypothetical protein